MEKNLATISKVCLTYCTVNIAQTNCGTVITNSTLSSQSARLGLYLFCRTHAATSTDQQECRLYIRVAMRYTSNWYVLPSLIACNHGYHSLLAI